ncbi:hypothetical protein [Dokdonia sp.]|uniref:hypothetical protein n=1 Tax=Dokdonia sp. TaxID=2024995 RepID=UPI003263D804
MAIPKKGSRKISVDNVVYRWMIRRKYKSADDLLMVAIEKEEHGKTILYVITDFLRPDGAFQKIGTVSQGIITPKDIENYIRTALLKGWKPENNGSEFVLHM